MRKIVVSEGVTLDGVFDAETMGQWVTPFQSDERNACVRESILAADALVLGRKTYDTYAWFYPNQKKNEYGIADKMNSMPKFVATSTPLQVQWKNATVIQGNAVDAIGKLKQQPGQDILIMGSATLVQSLMPAGLIDEYNILVHPAVMGSGRRFFKDGTGLSRLKLLESRMLPLGVIYLRYATAR